MASVAPVTITLKLADADAPFASVTVAVIAYVPGTTLDETVTTPVGPTTEIPVICELSEVFLIE